MMHKVFASARIEHEIVAVIPALRRFAFRFVRSTNDADDLVQEVVCRALGHIDGFSAGTNLKSWMFTIMRNTYCTQYARGLRESCGRLDDAATYDVPVSSRQDWVMREADVGAAILRLSSGERMALLLIADGASYEAAAAACGCKVGIIKSRVSRAREHLAKLLGDPSPVAAVSIN